ncbi:unnamed protein product [Psylliodes chrysocephalus]|uniref:Uncharacterized protein n=1 Tax=Psylliodes chrysocephalus TaxID=3402493 RepID=A0A9P0G9B3_9CUCU|nr:unnamed protein product [Psylliodes chrysocephala]
MKRNRSIRSTNFLLLPVGPQVSKNFKEKILGQMLHDQIFLVLRQDQTILRYGETEFNRLGHDRRYYRTIIDRCRELGRLVLKAKELNPNVTKLSQLLRASNYQLLKQSVFKEAEFNNETNLFNKPSYALKVGISVRKCATMLKGDYLQDEILREYIPELEAFLCVMEAKWFTEVSSHAHRTLAEVKWNKRKTVPLTRDIQKLNKYLNKQIIIEQDNLEGGPNILAFKNLVEISLVMTIILNRRRVGEVQYMLLKDYESALKCDPNSDIFQILTESEKQLSQSLIRLEIKGKIGRGVPVLLTEKLQSILNLINTRREECGVVKSNPYLFPSLSNVSGHYPTHKIIQKWTKASGCVNVSTLTSTKLRKHVAVMAQLLNLREHELDNLAKFMGHDIRVHREYYRLADETLQLSKINKLLLNLEKAKLGEMKGKNLDEITFEDEGEDENSESEND